MNHLPALILLNCLNGFIFWIMWRGFYLSGDKQLFLWVFAFQLLGTSASFLAYFYRNSKFVHKLCRVENFAGTSDQASITVTCALAGAYGFASINLVVALVLLVVNGTIDIWDSGNAT